jgi:hypothetical protein
MLEMLTIEPRTLNHSFGNLETTRTARRLIATVASLDSTLVDQAL